MKVAAADDGRGARNPWVDCFRGFALVVIYLNHMPANPWARFTPSHWGPSDAAEIFVFLSGYAAATAYGRSFGNAGIGLGSAAVLFRCVQIYVAHLAAFLSVAALFACAWVLGVVEFGGQFDGLHYFFDHTQQAIPALLGLRYVPNYIDILPMYLVMMLWLPLVWTLSRIHVSVALAFPFALYVVARAYGWELTADPASGRSWFFNPFCWQLLFFTGFAFGSSWVRVPRWRPVVGWLCVSFVVLCIPLESDAVAAQLPWFEVLRERWAAALDKSHLGLIRYAHFLALAYLFAHCTATQQRRLSNTLLRRLIALGQQSLPVFLLGTVLSFGGGLVLGREGGWLDGAVVGIAGVLLMIAFARVLSWLDDKPWRRIVERERGTWLLNAAMRGATAFALLVLAAAPLYFLQSIEPAGEHGVVDAVSADAEANTLATDSVSAESESLPLSDAVFEQPPDDASAGAVDTL